ILRNVWAWLHWEVLSQPRRGGRRIDLGQLTFRGMLLWLQHYAEEWLGLHEGLQAPHSVWGGLMPLDTEHKNRNRLSLDLLEGLLQGWDLLARFGAEAELHGRPPASSRLLDTSASLRGRASLGTTVWECTLGEKGPEGDGGRVDVAGVVGEIDPLL